MTINVHVTAQNDLSMGALTHKGLNPAMAFPMPAPTASIEILTSAKHLPGYVLNKNKLTRTVLMSEWWGGDGVTLMLDGHDHGPFLQDLTPVPIANLWYAVMWPGSSRKCAFGASKVLADATPFGGAQLAPVPLPWTTCGEPFSGPTALSFTSHLNPVIVGFEGADIAAGVASIGATALIDYLFERLAPSHTPGSLNEAIGLEAIARIAGFSGRWGALKLAVASVTDGVISYARGQATGTGDWSIKVGVGTPFLGVEVSYTGARSPADRGWSVQDSFGPLQRTHALNKRESSTQVAGGASTTERWDPPPGPRRGGAR